MSFQKLFEFVNEEVEPSNTCKNYRADTETCRTGCPKAKVDKGAACPYYSEADRGKWPGDFEGDCPCYYAMSESKLNEIDDRYADGEGGPEGTANPTPTPEEVATVTNPEADPAADVSSDQVKEPSDATAENQLFLFGAGEQLYYIKETGSDVVIVGDKGEETKKENSDEVYKDAKDKAAELILKFAADKGANAIDVEAVKKYFLKVVEEEEEKEEGLATTASSDDTSVKSDATGAVVPAEESDGDEIEVREGESESTTGMESIARQSVDHMTKHAVESKTSKVHENTRDLFLVD